MWNLGFRSLFPKFANNGIEFPVSQAMEIELGLTAAMALMGMALQFRILTVLQKKLLEIAQDHKILGMDPDTEAAAIERLSRLDMERDNWEKEHPSLAQFGRQDSTTTSTPLIKARDITSSPTPAERRSSTYTLVDGRPRYHSGVSDLKFSPLVEDGPGKSSSRQAPGALPTLDLGLGIEEDVPGNYITKDDEVIKKTATPSELEDLRRKEEIMAEIQTLRRSIEALKSETPGSSSSSESRRPSLTSRRTLSIDATTALQTAPTHLRPPRAIDPRSRAYSMELTSLDRALSLGNNFSRPTSAPLRDEEWETYIDERRLLQPPAGVTAPIATTPINPAPRISIPSAVQDALTERKRRESALGMIERRASSSDDTPLSKLAWHKKSKSGSNVPMAILPPKKSPIVASAPQRPVAPRSLTFEELNERHRERMRDLQGPLTQAEKEHAAVSAAKQRWERAKAVEKQAVTRRQAEKVAQLGRNKRIDDEADKRKTSLSPQDRRRHSRSLSVDKLGGSHSRKLSVMKVEDWQRYQQDTETAEPLSTARHASKAESIPFPDASGERRKS